MKNETENYLNLPGIHIQWPWSNLIVNGTKLVETRSYPLPQKHIGTLLAIIETPGKAGKKQKGIERAQIIGLVRFSKCYRYETRESWAAEFEKHRVPAKDALFSFKENKEKWGWEIAEVIRLKEPIAPPKLRGIVFAKVCKVPKANLIRKY